MTDWGAHHVDIAQWAIGQNGDGQGPLSVTPVSVEHPVPYENGYTTVTNQYNTATTFLISCQVPDDVELVVRQRHRLHLALVELHVGGADLGEIATCQREHIIAHVEADGLALGAPPV